MILSLEDFDASPSLKEHQPLVLRWQRFWERFFGLLRSLKSIRKQFKMLSLVSIALLLVCLLLANGRSLHMLIFRNQLVHLCSGFSRDTDVNGTGNISKLTMTIPGMKLLMQQPGLLYTNGSPLSLSLRFLLRLPSTAQIRNALNGCGSWKQLNKVNAVFRACSNTSCMWTLMPHSLSLRSLTIIPLFCGMSEMMRCNTPRA